MGSYDMPNVPEGPLGVMFHLVGTQVQVRGIGFTHRLILLTENNRYFLVPISP